MSFLPESLTASTLNPGVLATIGSSGGIANALQVYKKLNRLVADVVSDFGADPTGATNSVAAFQAANDALYARGGGILWVPGVPAGGFYDLTIGSTPNAAANPAVWQDDNVVVMGCGNGSLLQSTTPSSAANHGFAFFANRGWNTGTAGINKNCAAVGLRFRRPIAMSGTEGPFDSAVAYRGVDSPWFDQLRCEGGSTGVSLWECTRQGWGVIEGYRNADIALRINGDAVPSAVYTKPGIAVAIESGYQLLTGSAVPEPAGAVGSGHLCTQDDVNMGVLVSQDCKHNGLEIGGPINNLQIGLYVGIIDTAGRSVPMLLANYDGVEIEKVLFLVNAAGTVGAVVQGDGSSQVQRSLTIGTAIGWDRTGDTVTRDVVSLGRDCDGAIVGKVVGINMRAMSTGGGGTPLVGTRDLDVDQIFSYNPPAAGAYLGGSTGGTGNVRHRYGRIFVLGGRGAIADPKQNSGVVFDGAPSPTRVDSMHVENSAGFGIYTNATPVEIGERRLINNTAGQVAVDNSGSVVCNVTGSGTPEGNVVASPSSLFRRKDGGAGTCFYVKEGAGCNSTGWVGK